MGFGEYIQNPNTKLLLHLNGNSNDSSGNGNNGTDTAITYGKQYGKFNEGASFNGSSSKITLPQSTALDLYTFSHTSIMWVKIANYSTGTYPYAIFGKGNWDLNKTYFICRIAKNGKVEYFISSNKDAQLDYFITTETLPLNQWNCIVGVWDKPNRNIKLYLNGSLWAGTITLTGASLPIYTESVNAYVGAATNGGDTGYFKGNIDEVIAENRIWTPQEIQKYYTMSKGWF